MLLFPLLVVVKEAKFDFDLESKARGVGVWHIYSNNGNGFSKSKWNKPVSTKAIWVFTFYNHESVMATPGPLNLPTC